MEKITNKTRTIVHDFYCDDCGIHLGSSEEWYDGYYPSYGGLELYFKTPQGNYTLHKCLCSKCRQEFLSELTSLLTDIGFRCDE
jgi:hypothetical protein